MIFTLEEMEEEYDEAFDGEIAGGDEHEMNDNDDEIEMTEEKNEVENQERGLNVYEVEFNTSAENEIEVYHPKITRPTISKYEYVRVITALAKYLFSLSDLSSFVKDKTINTVINQTELAYQLLKDGKFDAVIDRGCEKVTLSVLEVKISRKIVSKSSTTFSNSCSCLRNRRCGYNLFIHTSAITRFYFSFFFSLQFVLSLLTSAHHLKTTNPYFSLFFA
ncbi:hypothetical protein FACS189472_17940 [Alphaproteobacteria bacterium]|nr:hypothetical protein FACS189472_17940 [Alphaproteobacteria bacterium]